MAKSQTTDGETKRKRRARQIDLIEPAPVDQELRSAAETLREHRNDRIAAGRAEGEAQERLLELMDAHKLTEFAFDGLVVEVIDKGRKVSVKAAEQTDE